MKSYIFFSILFLGVTASIRGQITWNPAINIASAAHGNDHPRIVVDRAGNPMVIWSNAKKAIFSKWNGSGFTAPRIVNPTSMDIAGATWMGPGIAAHGDTVYVVFKEVPEDVGHSWCVYSYDGGLTFSEPVRVDFIADSLSRFPAVTTDATGHPIVAFMKFDEGFSEARWAVTRSDDFGNSFSTDVQASGWSSPSSDVCDCCPGTVVSTENTVAMVYRDNNSNIRDTWVGLSSDLGATFSKGINVDQQSWMIHACPASGPDGTILGDTLYTTFMSSASGMSLVYFNHTALTDLNSSTGIPVTNDFPGLVLQNYPRIAGSGNALGVAWKQVVNGKDECALKFTNDITGGLPANYDTVDLDNIVNVDLAIWNGNIYVVWEDNGTGTIKFRSGTYEAITGFEASLDEDVLLVYPNPSNDLWTIEGDVLKEGVLVEIYNIVGHLVYSNRITDYNPGSSLMVENIGWGSGVYFLKVFHDNKEYSGKLVKR